MGNHHTVLWKEAVAQPNAARMTKGLLITSRNICCFSRSQSGRIPRGTNRAWESWGHCWKRTPWRMSSTAAPQISSYAARGSPNRGAMPRGSAWRGPARSERALSACRSRSFTAAIHEVRRRRRARDDGGRGGDRRDRVVVEAALRLTARDPLLCLTRTCLTKPAVDRRARATNDRVSRYRNRANAKLIQYRPRLIGV